MPDYGINLKKFLFEPSDGINNQSITEEIKNKVSRFLPQLTITNVSYFTNNDEDGFELKKNEVRVLVNFTFNNSVFSDDGSVEITFQR